ncbi:hypothetical protein E8E15_003153 [Penicillium rubens]|nr:hypothetical protein E8E15_003153 [Penicillium rubens]
MSFFFASPSDVTIIVIEEPSDNEDHKTKTAFFHVDRSKLIESSAYFQGIFSSRWARNENHKLTLRDDTIKGMEVMLGSIHGVDIKPESVSVADVWYTIKACNKYLLDRKKLMDWFARWIKYIREERPKSWEDEDFNRQLLFPCHFFDHIKAFQHVSRRLVYTTPGQITELAPTDSPSFEPMHMPAIVMLQYARRQVEGYFDGLCLDCMKNHPNENSEYWALGTRRVYDSTCRISHGEPTWYFSFMGRRDRSPYRMQP